MMTPSVVSARGRRPRLWLAAGLSVVLVAPGCATKKDLRLLRDEMVLLQAHQDSLFSETQRQNRLLLDTLRANLSVQMDAAGQTSHRFQQLEQQLERTEAVLQQMQLSMTNFTDRLDRQIAMNPAGPMRTGSTAGNPTGGTGSAVTDSAAGAGEADQAYNTGMQKMAAGAYTTARDLFEFFLERFPADPRAADVQLQIAETYAQEADYARAIEELEKLEATYASTNRERSAQALLRAGILAEERLNDPTRARQYYQTVIRRYPETEAHTDATARLNRRG
jgi:TolA-binding protein